MATVTPLESQAFLTRLNLPLPMIKSAKKSLVPPQLDHGELEGGVEGNAIVDSDGIKLPCKTRAPLILVGLVTDRWGGSLVWSTWWWGGGGIWV